MSDRHWSVMMVEFLAELGFQAGVSLVGADEGCPEGDEEVAQVTIGHLPGRWWIVIDDGDNPVICMTDGTAERSQMIWFHEDGGPFRDALIESLRRWQVREEGNPDAGRV